VACEKRKDVVRAVAQETLIFAHFGWLRAGRRYDIFDWLLSYFAYGPVGGFFGNTALRQRLSRMTAPETNPVDNPNPIPGSAMPMIESIVVSPTSEMPTLTPEMVEYLNDRAKELGISFADAYNEEMAARAELAQITPSYNELVLLAKRFPAPQEWYDE
jgi:hypothetical protein